MAFGSGMLPAQSAPLPAGQQVLHPGDSVRVLVWRQPELSGGFYVSPEGTLEHPLYRSVVVAGVPLDTARARLRETIQKYIENPEFVMEPFFRVIVAGQVRLPGVYSMPRQATVVQALAVAGGPTQNAQLDRITLVRNGVATRIDLTDFTNPLGQSLLLSGDQIVVPQDRGTLRNYIGPIAAMVAALAAITNVMVRR